MVGKLIKHDIKDSSKAYLPVFGMILVGTILALFSLTFAGSHSQLVYFLSALMDFVIFGLIIAVTVLTIRGSIYVLYGSIYTKNAYRLFTLPVASWKIIVSKIITSIFWSTLIGLMTLFSVGVIVGYVSEDIFIIFKGLQELIAQLSTMVTPTLVTIVFINYLLSTILGYMVIIFAGSFTNSSFVRKNRGIVTFVTVLITLAIHGRIAEAFGANALVVFSRYNMDTFFTGTLNVEFMDFFWVFVFMAIFIAGLVFGTLWLWDNKLEVSN